MLKIISQGQNKPSVNFKANLYNPKKTPKLTELLIREGWSLLVLPRMKNDSIKNSPISSVFDYVIGYKSLPGDAVKKVFDIAAMTGYTNIAFNPKETKKINEMVRERRSVEDSYLRVTDTARKLELAGELDSLRGKIVKYVILKIKRAKPFKEDMLKSADLVSENAISTFNSTCDFVDRLINPFK